MDNLLGLYEKALPNKMNWYDKLYYAKNLGFDFMEISIDESDDRLQRLYWDNGEKRELRTVMEQHGMPIMTMCFSGHRRFPLGSRFADVRDKAIELMKRAISFAGDMGIRVIQLAGYDVFYEASGDDTRAFFLEGLKKSVEMAERYQVMLAIEIMDTPFLNSVQKYMYYDGLIKSPWLGVYPDIGNLSAWNNNVEYELEIGCNRMVAVHIKETRNVRENFAGQFRDVPFGEGEVNFISIFRKLNELCYRGPFVLEMWGDKLENPLAEISRSRQFVLEKLAKGGYR